MRGSMQPEASRYRTLPYLYYNGTCAEVVFLLLLLLACTCMHGTRTEDYGDLNRTLDVMAHTKQSETACAYAIYLEYLYTYTQSTELLNPVSLGTATRTDTSFESNKVDHRHATSTY